jgi:ATP-dependent exoDNAse (exonuclease V) beta subunit
VTAVRDRPDEAARRRIVEALDETLVVEAAAGTGKTTELVNRILRVLAMGRADVREIVAVTFTEKAAGELKLRLRQELEVARAGVTDVAVAERLEAAVQNLEEAHVSTIHGFCADLLRERPVEARVDPLFRVLTEGQSERLFNEAFTAWFQQQLENPPEGVRRSLRRASRALRPGEVDEDGPVERLRRAGWDLVEWRDFEAPWTRDPFDRGEAIRRVAGLVHELGDLSRKPSYPGDNLFVDTAPVRRLSDELRRAAPRRAPAEAQRNAEDDDALESALIELRRNRDFRRARKGSGPTFGPGVTRAQVLAARDALTQALDDFQLHADADLAALLHGELLACVAGYEALKAKAGALDFVDLLLRARDLVRDDEGVRRHFQQRFRRIFVDEFQDTDPLQAELLLLLAADDPLETRWQNVRPVAGKLFIVGDPKQSIYRFRRADVEIYRRVCQRLIEAGATRVLLETSFRAVPNIQRLVNTAFRDVMDGDGLALQAPYVALAPDRAGYPAQPSVVVLPVPRPYAQRYVAAKAIEESLPDAVGAFVEWLQRRSGWKVTERRQPGKRVDIEPRHICILFRRFLSYGRDMTRPYVEALEARGLRHLLVGGKAFHDREEIEALRAALMAVEWPDDQLSVFATLRGPLFALGDEELLEYHHRFGGPFHPFRVPAPLPSHLEPVGEALTLLRRLHECRNRQPVAQTIAELVDATRAHAGFVLRPGGEQALANVLHVAELARQYELDGGMSFRGFVDTLQRAAEGGQAAEAPILEEGSDGVRLMTVHKAKGLEFPVVILADITARLTPNEASRHIDPDRRLCALRIGGWSPIDLVRQQALEQLRERKEGERVAYVAATRARDLLVVPAVGDVQYEGGWVSPLNTAIYPDESVRRVHKAARGCPSFKSRDSVLERPDNDPFTRLTMCPGEHVFPYGEAEYSVVWWSPEPDVLPLGAQAPFGLRRDDLIVKDVPVPVLRGHLDAYHLWRATRQAAIASAAAPTLEVLTVSEAIARVDLSIIAGAEVTIESVEGASERLGGVRYGTLVHAMLADVPLAAPAARELIERLAVAHGRVLGATAEEVDAARDTIQRVLAHPLIARAARASADRRCHRETPITYRLDSGALIEGVVDLAFDEPDGYTVVDFKTDRELEGSLDRYRLQVQVYAAAIAAATGRRARAVLMRV